MQVNDYFRMFAYDHWANRELLTAMHAAASISPDAVARMAHILAAQKLWLERIQRQPQTMPVWPSTTVKDCMVLADEMSAAWRNYLEHLEDNPSLEDMVDYRNTKGEPWSSRVEDILTHVLFHSMYHRGQIALQMRSSGLQPAYTDFIHAVRQGFLDRD